MNTGHMPHPIGSVVCQMVVERLVEYLGEIDHNEGDNYWDQFSTVDDATRDFGLFLSSYMEPPRNVEVDEAEELLEG